jgi:hypothetical protein
MLDLNSRLRPREDEVLAKVMDGEAVIIDLASGLYYSASGVGAVVWSGLEQVLQLSDVAAEIAARYDAGAEQVRADVLEFAAELLKENLVVPVDGGAPAKAHPPAAAGKLAYERPQIHVYRDMEGLLALDPPTPGLADLRWKE